MSIHKRDEGYYEVRWREGGRNKSVRVHGAFELAKKVERKKMSRRDENRHLDIKREVNFRMSALIERYLLHYGVKKRSADREKSILVGIEKELGNKFVREVDGVSVGGWYENLMSKRGLSAGTAVRHFNGSHDCFGRFLVTAKCFRMWWPETASVTVTHLERRDAAKGIQALHAFANPHHRSIPPACCLKEGFFAGSRSMEPRS